MNADETVPSLFECPASLTQVNPKSAKASEPFCCPLCGQSTRVYWSAGTLKIVRHDDMKQA